jgi:hypothetical protein
LPPFISFSTSYPELPPMPNCMARKEKNKKGVRNLK